MNPWNLVFLAGFIVYTVIRGVFIERTKRIEKHARHSDGLERAALGLVALGNMLLPVLYIFTPWLSFADYALPTWAPWVGAAVMILSLRLFWRSHADLGENWSAMVELRKGHQLIQRGVYRKIRHPMYAAIFAFGIAQGLLLANWLAGWAAFATFAPLYLLRAPREERLMIETFGDEYRQYMRRTGRILPRF